MQQQRTVTISLPPQLAKQIDSIARKEGRSRSELMREALRQYMARGERWEQIFAYGKGIARKERLTDRDVAAAVKQRRRARAS